MEAARRCLSTPITSGPRSFAQHGPAGKQELLQSGCWAVGTPGVLWCSGAPRPKLGRRPKVDLGAQTDVVVPSIVRAELGVAWAARGALEGRVILKVNNRIHTRRGTNLGVSINPFPSPENRDFEYDKI